ncbi:hypothetical protein [Haloferula sp.]|uniref:hypothetical protein n=1 Tax=Haloferula sp. TaxID=2497595 RepID=UPI003C73CBE7
MVILIKNCGVEEVPEEEASDLLRRVRDRPPPSKSVPDKAYASVGRFESEWRNPKTDRVCKVRKLLTMKTVPIVKEFDMTAEATVTVQAIESAEIWNDETRLWEQMTPSEFAHWRQGNLDDHTAIATLKKELDAQGEVASVSGVEFIGDGQPDPSPRYNETMENINITLEWRGDDLNVKWSSSNTERETIDVRVPFSSRFQTDDKESEQGG